MEINYVEELDALKMQIDKFHQARADQEKLRKEKEPWYGFVLKTGYSLDPLNEALEKSDLPKTIKVSSAIAGFLTQDNDSYNNAVEARDRDLEQKYPRAGKVGTNAIISVATILVNPATSILHAGKAALSFAEMLELEKHKTQIIDKRHEITKTVLGMYGLIEESDGSYVLKRGVERFTSSGMSSTNEFSPQGITRSVDRDKLPKIDFSSISRSK